MRAQNNHLSLLTGRFTSVLNYLEQKLLEIVQNSVAPSLLIDLITLKILEANEQFLELTHYSYEDIVGSVFTTKGLICNSCCQEKLLPALQSQTSLIKTEVELLCKFGQNRFCLVSIEPLTLGGKPHALVMFANIPERRHTKEELAKAVKLVLQDTDWITQNFLEKLVEITANENKDKVHSNWMTSINDLTPREIEVLAWIATGESDAAISATLGLSITTVHNYVHRIYQKIDVHSRAEAVVWARERGVIKSRKELV